MNKQKMKEQGFVHPILLVFLLVAIVGIVGYSGQKVVNQKNKVDEQSYIQSAKGTYVIDSVNSESSDQNGNTVSVNRVGSAASVENNTVANEENASFSRPESKQISSEYEVSTPLGSLSQLISLAKQKDYDNTLYFITPRLMYNVYDAVKSQNLNDFSANCQNNSVCNTLLTSKVEVDASHITESYCNPPENSSFTECKKIGIKFVLENGTVKTVYYKTVGSQVHEASINMLHGEGATNWVVDQISVDGFSI